MANNQHGLLGNHPMLDLGIGLLAASGPSPVPTSTGQNLASAMQFMSQRERQRLQNEGARERLRQLQEQRRQGSAVQEFIQSLGQFGPTPTQPAGQGLGALMPQAVQQRQQQAQFAERLNPMQRQFLSMQAQTDPQGAMQNVGGLLFEEDGLSTEIAEAERALGRPLTAAERLKFVGVEQSPEQRKAAFLEGRGIDITPEIARELVSAGGTTVNVGGDSPLDELIPISSIDDVRMPDGNPVPIGTTFRQANQAGAQVLSSDEQKALSNAESARAILNELEQLATGEEGIFSSVEPGFLNRVSAALDFGLQTLTQEDPRVSRFRDLSRGSISRFVRTLGERGALAEGDVNRALGLVPRIFPLPDTGQVAKDKINDLRSIIKKGVRNLNRQGSGGNQNTTSPDGPVDLGDGVTLEFVE